MFDDLGKLEFGLLNGHEESSRGSLEATLDGSNTTWSGRTGSRCTSGSSGAGGSRGETEHIDDLLGRIVLASSEDVGFRAICESEFVDLGHGAERDQTDQGVGREEAETDDDRLL